MSMLKEFKEFALRGNVVDMAVGVVIGAAFGKIVSSLAEAKEMGIPVIAYGQFLNNVIDFLIVAFAIFIVVKQINRFFPKAPAKEPRKCPYCKEVIADDATRCPHCTAELK